MAVLPETTQWLGMFPTLTREEERSLWLAKMRCQDILLQRRFSTRGKLACVRSSWGRASLSPRQHRQRVSYLLWFLRQVYLARLLLPVPPSLRLMFQLASRKKKRLKVVTLAVGRPLRRKWRPKVLRIHQVVKPALQQRRRALRQRGMPRATGRSP